MRTIYIFLFLILIPVSYTYARDLTTCTASDGTTGYLVENPRQSTNTETVCWSCQEIADYGGVECWRFFNTGDVWTGLSSVVYCAGTYEYATTPQDCSIRVPAGYDLDTDFVFDEDRWDEAIKECTGDGLYCPGAPYDTVTYTELMSEYMGSTGVFAKSCPTATDTYTTSELKQLAATTSDPGASSIHDCYLPSGTYYDSTGSFEINNAGTCYYQ